MNKPAKQSSGRADVNISKLSAEYYEGMDASLRISLKEYGFAWRQFRRTTPPYKKGDYRFCVGRSIEQGTCSWVLFSFHELPAITDWKTEWAFAYNDKEAFLSFLGMTEEEFSTSDLPRQVADLIQFYGVHNVFGSSDEGEPIGGL